MFVDSVGVLTHKEEVTVDCQQQTTHACLSTGTITTGNTQSPRKESLMFVDSVGVLTHKEDVSVTDVCQLGATSD